MTHWINEPTISSYLDRINKKLEKFLFLDAPPAPTLQEALHYVVFNGGKRLRPLLIYSTGRLLNAPIEILDRAAVAVELIHCYSLVHDDLPSMDNAPLRRGKKTCHIQFNEATAVLVGDTLQSLAFEILATIPTDQLAPEKSLAMIQSLANSIGPLGMAAGQMIDLISSANTTDEIDLRKLHDLKTGKLFQCCFELAILAANDNNLDRHAKLRSASKHLGLAFQVQDDILDVISSTDRLGKISGQDHSLEKITFATIMSLNDAQKILDDLFNSIETLLIECSAENSELSKLIHCVAKRTI